jgi:hypothetical protein
MNFSPSKDAAIFAPPFVGLKSCAVLFPARLPRLIYNALSELKKLRFVRLSSSLGRKRGETFRRPLVRLANRISAKPNFPCSGDLLFVSN